MSRMPAANRSPVLDDLPAGLRHFLIRVRMTACDPLALFILVFAGLVTIPIWTFGLGIDPGTAAWLPLGNRCGSWISHLTWTRVGIQTWFRTCNLTFGGGPPVPLHRMATAHLSSTMVVGQLLWSVLVAAVVAGRVSGRSAAGAPWAKAMPALPIGPRSRVTAEVLAGLAFVVAARAAALVLGGEPLAGQLWGYFGRGPAYPGVLARTTALGALLVFPILLAWRTAARFDWRGLSTPAVAMPLLLASALVGAMAHLWSALLLSLALSALLLVRVDDGDRPGAPTAERPVPLRLRSSPGPLQQFRRDAWLGPARTLWLFAVVVIPPPIVLGVLYPRRFLLVPLFQILTLAALPFFPFGMKLTGSGGSLFSGRFLRSWSPLPVPRQRVIRGLYAHGLIAAGVVWLVLCAHVAQHGGARALGGLPLFELPAVLLVAGIVTCEAVGDRGRGLLAIGCLVGFQFVVPAALALANTVVDLSAVAFARSESFWLAEAFGLGLLGGLPPLVHLRRGALQPA